MSTFTVSPGTVLEEAGTVTFTITRTAGTGNETITWATANGTATAGSDYTTTGGTLNFTNAANSLTFTISITDNTVLEGLENFLVNFTSSKPAQTPAFSSTITINDAADCFMAGTMIRTPEGDVAIETLKVGQLVTTADGRDLPLKWLGVQTIALRFADPLKTAPICIKAGAFDENVPSRDLHTSAGHAMILDGNMVIAGALVNGRSVVRAEFNEPRIVYYHIELEEHAVVFANDAATETFVDNVSRARFDNESEYKSMYPNAKPMKQLDLPHVKSQRQLPSETRKRLAARAAILAGDVSKVA